MALGDSRFSAPVNKAAAAGSALHTRSRCRTHWLHSLMVQVSRMHQVAQRMCDSPPTCSRWPYLAIEHPTSTWHRIAAGASPSLHRWRQPQPQGVCPRGEPRQALCENDRLLERFATRAYQVSRPTLAFQSPRPVHSASCQSQQQIWQSLAPRCLRYGTPVVAYYRHESSCLGTALGCVMGFH